MNQRFMTASPQGEAFGRSRAITINDNLSMSFFISLWHFLQKDV